MSDDPYVSRIADLEYFAGIEDARKKIPRRYMTSHWYLLGYDAEAQRVTRG
jgi:hypothetical protein